MEIKECPIFDMSCPYCLASGECMLTHPEDECDDYMAFMEDDE